MDKGKKTVNLFRKLERVIIMWGSLPRYFKRRSLVGFSTVLHREK